MEARFLADCRRGRDPFRGESAQGRALGPQIGTGRCLVDAGDDLERGSEILHAAENMDLHRYDRRPFAEA